MPSNDIRVLLVEDSEDDAVLIEAALRDEGLTVHSERVSSGDGVRRALAAGPWDLVITDYVLPGLDGLEVLRLVRESGAEPPAILVSGKIGETAAVDAMRAGARDYVSKDHLERLAPVVRRELEEIESRRGRRAAEAKYEVAFRASPNSIILTALADGRILEVNRAFEEMTGYSRQEVLDRTTVELGFWPDADARGEFARRIREKGSIRDQELSLRRKDGAMLVTLLSSDVVDLPEGRAVLTVTKDVTEQHRARRALERSEERFSKAFFANPNPAVITAVSDGKILEANQVLCDMAGVSRDELLGRNGVDLGLWNNTSATRLRAILARHSAVRDLEVSARSRNGARYDLLLSAVAVEVGGEQCILSVGVDITERKQLQAQLLRAQRLESIGTLAGGIAHDLNNVLTPILMAIKLLRQDRPQQRERVLSILEGNARRGADLIRQVLTFARGTEGRRGPLALPEVVDDVASVVRDTFPKSIDLRMETEDDLWIAHGDPNQIHQVLLNLAVNARDAMGGRGTLSIAARNRVVVATDRAALRGLYPGRYVEVEVADTGPGIPVEARGRVFDPFFTTKDPDHGTGLGLFTSESIITGHGGLIDIADGRNGEGARFLIYLPAAAADRTEERPERALVPSMEGNGELVLIVDDEEAVREIAAGVLEVSGYRTVPAAHGRAALARFEEHRDEIRAVVVDMMMPGMDGPETIRRLRRLAPAVPILAVSGVDDGLGEERAPPGADLFLSKPLTAEELLDGLRTVLAGAAPQDATREVS